MSIYAFNSIQKQKWINYLIVDDIGMWRGVERIDGLQDVMSQVGQVDDGIGHHCLYVGRASHQKRDRGLLRTWRHRWLDGVFLWGEIREKQIEMWVQTLQYVCIYTKKQMHILF